MKVGLLNIDATFGSLNVHFDNLVGGGDFGEVINQIISLLGKQIWDLVRKNSKSQNCQNWFQNAFNNRWYIFNGIFLSSSSINYLTAIGEGVRGFVKTVNKGLVQQSFSMEEGDRKLIKMSDVIYGRPFNSL